jgi:hypothetical protein
MRRLGYSARKRSGEPVTRKVGNEICAAALHALLKDGAAVEWRSRRVKGLEALLRLSPLARPSL